VRLLGLRKTKGLITRENREDIEISKGFLSDQRGRDSEMGSAEAD